MGVDVGKVRGCGDCVEVAGGGCLVLREEVRIWRRREEKKIFERRSFRQEYTIEREDWRIGGME